MMIARWMLAASGVVAAATLAAEPAPFVSEVTPAAIDKETFTEDVALQNVGDRMTVNVSVGGNGPYRFLVDTGAERTIISRQLAKHLRLEGGKSAVLHSVIGRNNVETVYIPALQVSSKVIRVVDAPALEATHIGADGMLGIDSLKSQRVLFNFKTRTMSITPAGKQLAKMDGETVIVRAKSRNGRLIFTEAQIDGQPVTVIVDTGSQVTIGNMALQRRLMGRKARAALETATIESVTGEKLTAQIANVEKLKIGEVSIDDLPVAFADAHIFRQLELDRRPTLLLGMNAMRAFDQISIDFAAKKVHFVLPRTSMVEPYRLASIGGI